MVEGRAVYLASSPSQMCCGTLLATRHCRSKQSLLKKNLSPLPNRKNPNQISLNSSPSLNRDGHNPRSRGPPIIFDSIPPLLRTTSSPPLAISLARLLARGDHLDFCWSDITSRGSEGPTVTCVCAYRLVDARVRRSPMRVCLNTDQTAHRLELEVLLKTITPTVLYVISIFM